MYKKYIKRNIDIFFAFVSLPVLLVVFIFVAPFIVLTDKGSIFYNAKRIGKDGKLFKMYKFRSMTIDAPDIRLPDGSTYNAVDDQRVTKVGKFLRETSPDELPQIINILKGDMSLIGPRPDPPDWLDRYSEDVRIFLTVRPGITGYSQAYYRNSIDSEEKMKNDVYYAQNCSFTLDSKILLKTAVVVLKKENTYADTSSAMPVKDLEIYIVQKSKEETTSEKINS